MSNTLATYVLLVCRVAPIERPIGTRAELQQALRLELKHAIRHLLDGGIAPVDLAQAAIGPGMSVFGHYAGVMESDGRRMTVRTVLGLINRTIDEVLAEQEGEFDSDTRWAITWFEQHAMDVGAFGEADALARAKNSSVQGLAEAGIVVAKGGKVRLVRRDELSDDWDPKTDRRLTVWEITQHLVRALDKKGEDGAADLLRAVGGLGEVSRDLAYRLYGVCEKKKWADEALAYNSLVVSWPTIAERASSSRTAVQPTLI